MPATTEKKSKSRASSFDAQVRELVGLFAGILKGLKADREEEKPKELQKAFDEGALGERHFPPLIVPFPRGSPERLGAGRSHRPDRRDHQPSGG